MLRVVRRSTKSEKISRFLIIVMFFVVNKLCLFVFEIVVVIVAIGGIVGIDFIVGIGFIDYFSPDRSGRTPDWHC